MVEIVTENTKKTISESVRKKQIAIAKEIIMIAKDYITLADASLKLSTVEIEKLLDDLAKRAEEMSTILKVEKKEIK